MAAPFEKFHSDFSGGLNLGPQPADIGDTELSSLVNYVPSGKALRLRGAYEALSDQPYQPVPGTYSNLTAIQPWSGGNPREWDLFLGADESIARYDYVTGLFSRVPRSESGSYLPYGVSTYPWVSLQYKQILYFFRPGAGMRRVSRLPRLDSPPGIAPPVAAPTLSLDGAGQIPSADFKGMVTYYNSLTDAESNPSPASALYTHVGPAAILWTGLPVTSPTPQVNSIRLWRTLPNEVAGGDVLGYLVAQLPLGTGSYIDNFLVEKLGGPVTFDNDVPPETLRGGVIWQERLWAHDGRNLYASPIGRPESLPPVNVLQVFPDDGQDIVGLAADETRLYVGKTGSVIYLTGAFPNIDRNVLDARNGVVSHQTMHAANGQLIWRSPTDILISEGGPGRSLAPNRKLRTYMENTQGPLAHTEVATLIPEKKLYIVMGRWNDKTAAQLHHPHDVVDRDLLVVNYETGGIGVLRVPSAPPTIQNLNTLRSVLDWDGQERLFLGWGSFIQAEVPDSQFDDVPRAGSPPVLSTDLETGAMTSVVFGREITAPPGYVIAPRDLTLDSLLSLTRGNSNGQRFRVDVFLNGNYGVNDDIVHHPLLNQVLLGRDVRIFSLALLTRPGSKVLLGVSRRGIRQPFDIYGMGWTGIVIARRYRREA